MAETKADLENRIAELEAQLADTTSDEGEGGPDNRTVTQRILAIAAEVGVVAPERAGGVPFAFRGVDQVVSKLTPLLIKHGVFIAPVRVSHTLDQRDVGSKVVTKADVVVEYRAFGAAGDYLDFQVPGQADDFADRSTAQAMSVAFRILLLQLFHIAANGNEEAQSEETKNTREAAGLAKVEAARATATQAPSAPSNSQATDPAVQMRQAILASAGQKGWDGTKINEFGDRVTGVSRDVWFNDPDHLNTILSKINDAQ